jgi:hypothetical protein
LLLKYVWTVSMEAGGIVLKISSDIWPLISYNNGYRNLNPFRFISDIPVLMSIYANFCVPIYFMKGYENLVFE